MALALTRDEVGAGRLDLADLGGQIRRARRIGDLEHEVEAFGRREPVHVADQGLPESGVVVQVGDSLDAGAGGPDDLGQMADGLLRHLQGARLHAEGVLEAALGDLVGHRHRDHERHFQLFGDLGRHHGHSRLVAADDGRRARAGQPLHLLDRQLGLALRVRGEHLQLGPAHGFDAAGGIDFLGGEHQPVLQLLAVEGERARKRVDVADGDFLGLGPQQGGDAQRAGRNRRGRHRRRLDEFPSGYLPFQCLRTPRPDHECLSFHAGDHTYGVAPCTRRRARTAPRRRDRVQEPRDRPASSPAIMPRISAAIRPLADR